MFHLPEGRPAIMGILNVTPDSFSDGGQFSDPGIAVARAQQMMDEGADLVDVGGESTRPGADPVSPEDEIARIQPVCSQLGRMGISFSIDTRHSETAQAALDLGACLVNDVTSGRDPKMFGTVARTGACLCLMHMQGDPKTMQVSPHYEDVVSEVRAFLTDRTQKAEEAGIRKDRIWIDPGIGFGKADEHNLKLLAHLKELTSLPFPVLLGISRKGLLGRLLAKNGELAGMEDRLSGALAIQAFAQAQGVRILRVHNVREAKCQADALAAVLKFA